jgi:hypothetical protein
MMLCNMIHNVLHHMLRAKESPWPPFSPFPGLDRPACSARSFNNYLSAWPSSSESAMPRFGRGSSEAAAGRSGMRGGGALSLPRQPRRPRRSWVDTWCTRPASCAQRMKGLAGFVVDSIQRCLSAPSESADAAWRCHWLIPCTTLSWTSCSTNHYT